MRRWPTLPSSVTLSSSKPGAASPTTGSVTIPLGMITFPFTVTTTPVEAATVKPVISAAAEWRDEVEDPDGQALIASASPQGQGFE